MTPEANKAIVRRHIEEVFMGGHVELIDGYYVPDGSTPELVSPQEWRERVLWWHKAAPGFKLTILDIFAEGDKVMVHFQADVTYSNPMDPPPAEPFLPLNKPVSWRVANIFRIVNGKMVAAKYVNNWAQMLVDIGAIPLQKMEQNKTAAKRFVDALNRQDIALLNEVASPDVAQWWTNEIPNAYATFKDHHIDITGMIVDGDKAWVRLATNAYHTGEWEGIPLTGKHWTNQGIFYLLSGRLVRPAPTCTETDIRPN